MDAADVAVVKVASAIGEPARASMLYALLDGRARTSTELAMLAEVSPSTASVHLDRLKGERLVTVVAQGKHRYYSLNGPRVAYVLEGLSVLAGARPTEFTPSTPDALVTARSCYDHMAGHLAVRLHDHFRAMKWLSSHATHRGMNYEVTPAGASALTRLGIDVAGARSRRRQFARACLDWSERRPHIGGALGAAILDAALKKKWVTRELDSRALRVTVIGRSELRSRFGIESTA